MSYRRGHEPHWIQVRHARADPETTTCDFMSVQDEWIHVRHQDSGKHVRYWSIDARIVEELSASPDASFAEERRLEVSDRWGVM